MSQVIELNQIEKSFGEKTVLAGINININEGEIFGLLGPSGAGKTTLIKIITGQINATRGEATLFGENTTELKRKVFRNIGMVLDNSGLYERLNVYDNLKIFARIYEVPEASIDESLKKVGLLKDKKTIVNDMSKGMKQRLVLARAILHGPSLLFLDEPTSGLDPATSLKIHNLLLEEKRKGTTIFLTTHNMEEATKLCDRVALLNEGNIVECDNPNVICRKYNSQNKVILLLKNKEQVELINEPASAEKIAGYFAKDEVESIHSSEPNLEAVFIQLTGRRLAEDELS